jgi:hypothetical protein
MSTYDENSIKIREKMKLMFNRLDVELDVYFRPSREKSLVRRHLEEAFMWIDKCIQNEQLEMEKNDSI